MKITAFVLALCTATAAIAAEAAGCDQLLGGGWNCRTPSGGSVHVDQTLGGRTRYTYDNGATVIDRGDTLLGSRYGTIGRPPTDLPRDGAQPFDPYR